MDTIVDVEFWTAEGAREFWQRGTFAKFYEMQLELQWFTVQTGTGEEHALHVTRENDGEKFGSWRRC